MNEKRARIRELQKYEKLLTRQEYKTLRGQIMAGDADGARRGLLRIIGINAILKGKDGTEYEKVRADYEGY
uniref:Uncharacterized protein n=1 Tax=Caudovirales sp. ctrNG92 TaxID=2827638 RepID=A0A8S5SF02_9CAUD|nr:MAG TPA: hypothetical protein [Caudovirales sp. ctrNG92]